MTIADRAVLVTGANRGIGQALVEEALRRGAKRVYAGTRQPLAHPDGRVTPLRLDVTNPAQIQAAADQVETLDLLINNAGVPLRRPERSCRAGTPPGRQPLRHLRRDPGLPAVAGPFSGAIVNDLSIMALAPLPLTPAYSISKAAAFSLTQSLRALLAGRGVRVHAVLTGPTDTTDMVRDLDIPKTSPESVASAILDGVERGEEDIFPDPISQTLAHSWRSGAAKALERQNAALVAAPAAA
jgi:NAD(P)-dependent dehydrogenase (short-subunit alcohol dehydrogenase family)